MNTYFELNTLNGKTLFSGHYASFAACVEAAYHAKICLKHADFRFKPLANVSLDEANLAHADFSGANLSGANLSEIYAPHARFNGADLYNTCFAYAQLTRAQFYHAHFGGTDFSGADISGSGFAGQACLDLDFTAVHTMEGCTYRPDMQNHRFYTFSTPPVVVKGLGAPVLVTSPALRATLSQLLHPQRLKQKARVC